MAYPARRPLKPERAAGYTADYLTERDRLIASMGAGQWAITMMVHGSLCATRAWTGVLLTDDPAGLRSPDIGLATLQGRERLFIERSPFATWRLVRAARN